MARLMLEPQLPENQRPLFQAASAAIDNVHLVIRSADGTIVFDRIIQFAPGQNEVTVVADVKVNGESERFSARYELRSGDTPLYEGTLDVTARPGVNSPAPAVVPVTFVGPGATATRVALSPATASLLPGATTSLGATAFDAGNNVIAGTLFAWSTSNPAVATVSAAGVVTAGSIRGAATITASTLSGVAGTASVAVILPASQIAVISGNAQTGTAGSTLANPLVVQVSAADGVAVPGVSVAFSTTTAGASVGAAAAVTDANGRASTTMTLGGAAGTQSFRATAGSFTANATATAVSGPASVITTVSGNAQADTIGKSLPLPFVVKVVDAFGNAVLGATVTWTRTAGAGTTSATTSTTDAQGLSQVTYTLGNSTGNETIVASIAASGAGASVTFAATAQARPASALVVVSGDPQTGLAGKPFASPLVVRATDNLGNGVPGVAVSWTVAGSATLAAASSTTDATGQASMTGSFSSQVGFATVTARLAATPTVSTTFSLTALTGPAAQLTIVAGSGLSAAAGTPIPTAPSVRLLDALGNPVIGASVAFTANNGGSVAGSPATTNASGVATAGSWTLGAVAGVQTLTAAAGSLTATFTATATAPIGPPALSITTQPSASVSNTLVFAQQPVIQLKTAGGANLPLAGVVVTVAVDAAAVPVREGDAAVLVLPTLRGTLTATTNASGVATFANLSFLGATGNAALSFTAGGYTSALSATMTLTPGPAVYLMPVTATAINSTVGFVVAPNPAVIVKDSSMNAVSGVSVAFATPAAGNGLVSGGSGTTSPGGNASPASWTLDNVVGADTMTATSAGLVGSPVTFIATTTAGAATQLAIVSGDNQTGIAGNPLAAPLVVIAKDALNNPVSGVSIAFTSMTGGGTPSSQTITTNAGGQASFTLTLGAAGGHTVKACLPSCATAQVTFNAMAIPVGADAIWNGSASTSWSTAANWSPAAVPGGANNVFIPNGAPNAPALTAAQSVNHLTLASGAAIVLGGNVLTLGGDLLATGATMTSTGGYVYVCGGTRAFSGGSGPMVVDCGATVNAAGSASINGNFSTNGGGVFNVGAADVSVAGNLGMYSGSRIKMTTAGGKLTVLGDYDSNPGNDVGDTFMTEGLLEVKGNLTALNGGVSQSFRAVGNHVTRFSGSAAQAVNFSYTDGFHRSTFGSVEFTGNNTVTLVNGMRAFGSATLTGTTTLTGGTTLFHMGQLTTASGTSLAGLAGTELNSGGAFFPIIAGASPPQVTLNAGAAVKLPVATVAFPGNLVVTGGTTLDLEAKSLTVSGTLGVYGGSRVKMTQPGVYLRVDGTYDSNPGNDIGDTFMTEGLLELKGNLTAINGGVSQSFRAVGNHVTRFSGSAAQSVNFTYTDGYHRSTFGKVEFTGSNAVTLVNGMRAFGNVSLTGTTSLAGNTTLYHMGQLITAAGTSLAGLAATELNSGGALFPIVAGAYPPQVTLNAGGTVKLPSPTVVFPGNLVITGTTTLDLEAKSLTVSGTLGVYSGSRVKMTQAGVYLRVDGTYDSNPGNDIGDTFMTEGVLELKGNLSAINGGVSQSFRAVGNHVTRFSGSAAQSVNFTYTDGYHRSTFGHVEFTGNNAVTLVNGMRVFGSASVTGTTSLSGNTTLFHMGQLTSAAGASLTGLATTELNSGGAFFPIIAGASPPQVTLNAGATVKLPGATVAFPGNLVITGSTTLDLEAKSLTVSGTLGLYNGSRVKMTQAGVYLRVDGAFDSNPGNDIGDTFMTEGLLELKGNLSAINGGVSQSFRALGSHVTRFSGAGAQSVNFTYTDGYHRSTFGNVEFTGNNTVTLVNGMRAFGNVTVNGTTVLNGNTTLFHMGQLTTAAGTSLAALAATELNSGGAFFPIIAGASPPQVTLSAGATVKLPGATVAFPGNLVITGSTTLDLEAKSLTVSGTLGVYSGSRVKMTQAGVYLRVDGTYDSNPGNDIGDTFMTEGLLELKGNLTAINGGVSQSFRAVGNHVTRFSGSAAQAVNFSYTDNSGRSTFGKVEVTNSSASGVSTGNGMWVLGGFTNTGRFTIPASQSVNIQGALTLGPTSITTNSGTLNKGSCSILPGLPGPTISGFTCSP
jgi:hypothetical protein